MKPDSIESTITDAPAPLAARLKSSQEALRLAALAELLRLGQEISDCLDDVAACLAHANAGERTLAVEVLTRMGVSAVPALITGLEESQPPAVRIAAASGLGRVGPAAAPAIDRLSACLTSNDPMLRWHASFALGKMGQAAVPTLRSLLDSSNPLVVAAAVDAFEWIGEDAGEAVEDLQRLSAKAPSPLLQLACTSALLKISGDAAAALPVIEAMLQDENQETRKACLERLGMLTGSAREFVPLIMGCLEDPAGEVRAAATLALARIEEEPSRILEALTERLADPDGEVRANAAMGLARYGPAAASALLALRALQQDPEPRLVAIANGAIERIEKLEPQGTSDTTTE